MNSKQHYEDLLAPIYSWMAGGFEAGLEKNMRFFNEHELTPTNSGLALDLGAGCGFQSIPLAMRGFRVTAIDMDKYLLKELDEHANSLPIRIVEDDLRQFHRHIATEVELVVCMVDTLLHLESPAEVQALFSDVRRALEEGGRFIVTFRNLRYASTGLDRFIPVRSDDNMILTCFLDYEPDAVLVHDLVYRRHEYEWSFSRSCYRKLRLAPKWIVDQLIDTGFAIEKLEDDRGMITVIARKGSK